MEGSRGGASPSPSPEPGASNLAGEEASSSTVGGPARPLLSPPTVARFREDTANQGATGGSSFSGPTGSVLGVASPPPAGSGGGSSSGIIDWLSMEGQPKHKRQKFAEKKTAHGAPTPALPATVALLHPKLEWEQDKNFGHGDPTVALLPATPCTSRALLHPKLEWEQEEIHRPPPKQPEVIPPAPLKQQEEEDISAVLPLKQEIPAVAAPVPPGGKPWPPKLWRIAQARMFTHLPPGVPTKIGDDNNLKLAAAELQRRMGTNANLDHLTGSQQVATLPQLGNLHQRSSTFLMNRFSDYCDRHPMAHPPPPQA